MLQQLSPLNHYIKNGVVKIPFLSAFYCAVREVDLFGDNQLVVLEHFLRSLVNW